MNTDLGYGIGGLALGAGLGYLLGKRKPNPPANIVKAVSHIKVFDVEFNTWLTPEWMFDFVHMTNIKAALYVWLHNSVTDKNNPQAMMTVSMQDGMWVYEFGSQESPGAKVYYDGVLKLTLPSSQVFSV